MGFCQTTSLDLNLLKSMTDINVFKNVVDGNNMDMYVDEDYKDFFITYGSPLGYDGKEYKYSTCFWSYGLNENYFYLGFAENCHPSTSKYVYDDIIKDLNKNCNYKGRYKSDRFENIDGDYVFWEYDCGGELQIIVGELILEGVSDISYDVIVNY
jgi:hypothetical protein